MSIRRTRHRKPLTLLSLLSLKKEELVAFREEHGHCVVPKNYGPLGSWVRAQRHLMKEKGTLGSFEGGGLLCQQRVVSHDRTCEHSRSYIYVTTHC